ncbi:hypothetical protein HanXRQr2_Chr07g0302661 [Helianthus annuus]|uniref:Uncharacterized protein n=1 Tax=Helianthus annuus TaxID=4232 RepID=A0A9K3IMG4_HELAN|nr:hypothetical protein HanXRQr2_Chr07g0302661 [Helianthus annuus]
MAGGFVTRAFESMLKESYGKITSDRNPVVFSFALRGVLSSRSPS